MIALGALAGLQWRCSAAARALWDAQSVIPAAQAQQAGGGHAAPPGAPATHAAGAPPPPWRTAAAAAAAQRRGASWLASLAPWRGRGRRGGSSPRPAPPQYPPRPRAFALGGWEYEDAWAWVADPARAPEVQRLLRREAEHYRWHATRWAPARRRLAAELRALAVRGVGLGMRPRLGRAVGAPGLHAC
jgi:hypothetical protein